MIELQSSCFFFHFLSLVNCQSVCVDQWMFVQIQIVRSFLYFCCFIRWMGKNPISHTEQLHEIIVYNPHLCAMSIFYCVNMYSLLLCLCVSAHCSLSFILPIILVWFTQFIRFVFYQVLNVLIHSLCITRIQKRQNNIFTNVYVNRCFIHIPPSSSMIPRGEYIVVVFFFDFGSHLSFLHPITV